MKSKAHLQGGRKATSKTATIDENEQDGVKVSDQWLASLTPEQESVLVHGHHMVKRFSPDITLRDMSRASPEIRWIELLDRFRDIYSLDRLFKGFSTLRQEYAAKSNTVAPISFLAVSLNNVALDSVIPFKFCWLDIPSKQGVATLFMALNAWSHEEQMRWNLSSPGQRVKGSSAWETDISKSASAITLPYNVTERRILDIDEKIVVPSTFLHSLLWIDIVVNGKDIQGQGELLFPNGERLVSPGQCYTSIDLVNILMQYFHQQTPKQTWRSLQQNALDALCGVRAPSSQVRAMCQQIIADKRRKATAEEDEA